MTLSFPELFFSLCIQATILLGVTRWLTARQLDCRAADHLWSSCHSLILVLSGVGLLLPHLRLLPESMWPAGLVPRMTDSVISWAEILFSVWSVGCVLLVLAVVISFLQAARLVSGAQPVDRDMLDVPEKLTRMLVVDRKPVRILVSPQLVSPFCWQFHVPVIVLPESVLEFPGEELAAILRHEAAHLRAGHPIALFLQRLVEILFWFHPMVWTASRRAAITRELVCDLNASVHPVEAACLLKGLYRLSEIRMGRLPEFPAGLSFVGNGDALRQRVTQLLRISVQSEQHRVLSRDRGRQCLGAATVVAALIWLPFHPAASGRSLLSPWPTSSAVALKELGMPVRDYELDASSLLERSELESHNNTRATEGSQSY